MPKTRKFYLQIHLRPVLSSFEPQEALEGGSGIVSSENKKVKLLMQAPPTDPRTMPAIRMKAQVPCGQQQKRRRKREIQPKSIVLESAAPMERYGGVGIRFFR